MHIMSQGDPGLEIDTRENIGREGVKGKPEIIVYIHHVLGCIAFRCGNCAQRPLGQH